jgi:hypothetical protein
MAIRERKDDEWSLVSQQVHEEAGSPHLSGDERYSKPFNAVCVF